MNLTRWGYLGTLIWFCVFFSAVVLNAPSLFELSANEWGDFLAGAFAPLAFFWLVLGFFQQGKELQASVDALKLQAEELKQSVEQQKSLVGITKEQLALDIKAREALTAEQISKKLPYIVIRSAKVSDMATGRKVKFYAKNVGADMVSGNHYFIENGEVQIRNRSISHLGQGKEMEIKLSQSNMQAGKTYQLVFEAINIRGQCRRQVFSILDETPNMTMCDPE